MQIEFLNPIWFLLLIPIVGFVIWQAKKGAFASAFCRRLHTGMRLLLCLVLVLSMVGVQRLQSSDTVATVFAVDVSDSVAKDGAAEAFLREADEAMGKDDAAGLLLFAKTPSVEANVSSDTSLNGPFVSYTSGDGTDIAAALKMAAALLPTDAAQRIVLLTDGNETTSDALEQAKLLQKNGVTIDAYLLQEAQGAEVQLTALELAEVIEKNTEYEINVRIDASASQTAQLRLYKDNQMISDQSIQLNAGENRIAFTDRTQEGGAVIYRAEITSAEDTMPQNNQAYAYTYIDDVPQILLLQQDGSGSQWQALLSAGGVRVSTMEAASAPTAVEEFSRYDAVVLADVSKEELPADCLTALEQYVKNVGGGLMVSGGENSFALGGYYNTLLEEMLPVSMDLKTEGEEPNLGMVLVIDRSGSMMDGNYGVTRMEMAKEAAIRSLDSFGANDQIGVVAFDSQAEWAVPFQLVAGNEESITESIGKIQPAGGTSILPALQMAYDTLSKADTKQKHIILLTDGQAEQSGYDALMQNMQKDGITLSTVAVGTGSDITLMERLAQMGGGRYYFTNEFTDLPEIFLKETVLAGEEYLNQRTFYPQGQDASAILSGISAVPALDGYVGTTIKPRADAVLVSDEEEPILAAWQYGLGRTAVFTADVAGQWSAGWLSDDAGVSILRNSVSWVMKSRVSTEMRLSARAEDGISLLRLEMPFREEVSAVTVQVIDAENTLRTVSMQASSPGVYEGVLDTAEEGAYTANILLELDDGTQEQSSTGFCISYPLEYDINYRGMGASFLKQLVQAGGGRLLTSGAETFLQAPAARSERKDLSDALLIVALLLLLLDVALRRFSFLPLRMEQMWAERKQVYQQKRAQAKEQNAKKPKEKQQEMPQMQKEADAAPKQKGAAEKTTAEKLAAAKKRRGGS